MRHVHMDATKGIVSAQQLARVLYQTNMLQGARVLSKQYSQHHLATLAQKEVQLTEREREDAQCH